MKRALLFLPLLSIVITGCVSTQPKMLGVAYDKGDLERVEKAKTYRWSLPGATNPYNNQNLYLHLAKSGIEAEMAKKGYKLNPVKGGPADLTLSFLVVYQDEVSTSYVDKYFGTNRIPEHLIAKSGSVATAEYEVGTLIVDAEDSRDHESLWRGAVSAKVDRSKPYEAQKKRIDESVKVVMKDFPVAK